MLKVYFIRHSATKWNKQQKYLGRTDMVLSPNGQRQAKLIASFLKNQNISAIYSSNLMRAYQTACAIAKHHPSLKIKKDEALNEIDFGKWEGMTFNQIKRRYPAISQKYLSDPLNTKIPQGESLLKFRSRVNKALKRILVKKSGTIVIVSHGGVNRIIICSLLKLPLSYFWQIKQDIGAINIIEIHSPPLFKKIIQANASHKKWWGVISLINHTLWEN